MIAWAWRALAGAILLGGAVAAALSAGTPPPAPPRQVGRSASLVLLTLDTTRADRLGSYGHRGARTPVLDRLATRGVRYAHAWAPTPLTLPSHATLLTGLAPPEHGLRDNGTAVLPATLPTLATVLAARGYATGAFVSSRVLDARFGLGRGFAVYDDRMAAERVGEYGYPERSAAAVTNAAMKWLAGIGAARPFFLWVHYYDPHAPYEPLPEFAHLDPYDAELAAVDREIGRLLAALPGGDRGRLVAAVGDHGESLGEHGERSHGLFLYRSALEVPLIVAAPGATAPSVVARPVATQDLPGHLLGLLGVEAGALPDALRRRLGGRDSIYGETWMPLTAYGWSPLRALTAGRYRYIAAPRPEIFDVAADPGETRNLAASPPSAARGLPRELARLERGWRKVEAAPAPRDAELAAALESLGYAGGSPATARDGLDPKDGLPLLARFESAKRRLDAGEARAAAAELEELVRASPGNVPFLVRLASAQLAAGNPERALAALGEAIARNPRLEFLHLALGDTYLALRRLGEAERAYRMALRLDPRLAAAWIGLARTVRQAQGLGPARAVLAEGARARAQSSTLWLELGRLDLDAGDTAAARTHLNEAMRTAPGSAAARAAQALLARLQG